MRRPLRRLAIIGVTLLLLTALAVVAASAWMHQRHAGGRSIAAPVDAAIVLGGGIDPDGVLGYSSRRRVAAAVALLREGTARRLIVSAGTTGDRDVSGGELMRRHALALGAPPDAILVEGESRTTFENLRFSFEIARRSGFDRLAVVTDDMHLTRAALLACYFGDCGLSLVSAPGLWKQGWHAIVHDIARESLAWWYNLAKVVLWSGLGMLGMPEERREQVVA